MFSRGAVVIDGMNEFTGLSRANGREWRSLKIAKIERGFRYQQAAYLIGRQLEARQGHDVARLLLVRFDRSSRLLFRSRSRSHLICFSGRGFGRRPGVILL